MVPAELCVLRGSCWGAGGSPPVDAGAREGTCFQLLDEDGIFGCHPDPKSLRPLLTSFGALRVPSCFLDLSTWMLLLLVPHSLPSSLPRDRLWFYTVRTEHRADCPERHLPCRLSVETVSISGQLSRGGLVFKEHFAA